MMCHAPLGEQIPVRVELTGGGVEQVGAFGVVELQGPGNSVEYRSRGAREGPVFQFGVVLDADSGRRRHFRMSQCGYPAIRGQTGTFPGDLGAPRHRELPDFLPSQAQGGMAAGGVPCRYTSRARLPESP